MPFRRSVVVAAVFATTFAGVATPAFAATPYPSTLTATVAPASIDGGQTSTLSGRLTITTPSGERPLANQTIRARFDAWNGFGGTEFPKTDANGYYTVAAKPVSSGSWRVGYDGWPHEPGFPGADPAAAYPEYVNVQQLTDTFLVDTGRTTTGNVYVRGGLSVPSKYLPYDHTVYVRIEYSPDGVAWTTKATVGATPFHNGSYIYNTGAAEPAAGHWRAVHDGIVGRTKASTSGSRFVDALPA
ncbi:hypothetical protein GCM10022243_19340 [Saccharothrix violaceirubra]|uniref:Uncharacterized protein n=1 Tax=Saccharothrix violaceirubra TaxID=413306 RepID=A0A7W7T234_9PSEU|nr:hypothetical protein [Saccharothrix violaceirubra]MBB4965159.1 hypothetical protein [Saccharothrix violaceirubra]